MVFQWSSRETKSLQVSQTLLCVLVDLNSVVVLMISVSSLISNFSGFLTKPLRPFLACQSLLLLLLLYSFGSFSRQHKLMIFHRSLRDSKSPQFSRTLLSILADHNNAVVLISNSSFPFLSILWWPYQAQRFHLVSLLLSYFISYQFPSNVLVLLSFSPSFNFILWSAGTPKFKIWQVFFLFFFFFFVDNHSVWSSGRDYVIRLYIKITENSVRFVLLDEFWFRHIPFVHTFKFEFLAQFQKDHTPREFFTSALTGGLSLESDGQHLSLVLQDSSQYSGRCQHAVVCIVPTCPFISKSSSPSINYSVTAPNAPITIGVTVTFMLPNFFSSLARSRYLSLFISVLLCGQPERQIQLFGRFSFVFSFCWLSLGLVVWLRLNDLFLSQNPKEFCSSHFRWLTPSRASAIFSYDQILTFCIFYSFWDLLLSSLLQTCGVFFFFQRLVVFH